MRSAMLVHLREMRMVDIGRAVNAAHRIDNAARFDLGRSEHEDADGRPDFAERLSHNLACDQHRHDGIGQSQIEKQDQRAGDDHGAGAKRIGYIVREGHPDVHAGRRHRLCQKRGHGTCNQRDARNEYGDLSGHRLRFDQDTHS